MTCADPAHIMSGSDYCFVQFDSAVDKLNYLRGYIDGNPELKPYKDMILRENACSLFKLLI